MTLRLSIVICIVPSKKKKITICIIAVFLNLFSIFHLKNFLRCIIKLNFPLCLLLLQVEDDKIIIPRNSVVEVNQSGLLMETLIDITPKDPLPAPSVGPLDPDCTKEGLILCDKERMRGQQGVSLDALVGIFTRLGRDMEEIGVSKSYKLAEKVATIMEEAQPLLTRVHSFFPLFP